MRRSSKINLQCKSKKKKIVELSSAHLADSSTGGRKLQYNSKLNDMYGVASMMETALLQRFNEEAIHLMPPTVSPRLAMLGFGFRRTEVGTTCSSAMRVGKTQISIFTTGMSIQ